MKLLAPEKRPFVYTALLLFPLLFLAAVFFCRSPVVLVGDEEFDLFYGKKRVLIRRLGLSLSLFRRIKTVNIAAGAGPDLAAQAAAALSRRPRGVFFPYRYREGARRYLKNRPGAPVVILGGRNAGDPSAAGGVAEPRWFFTDTRTDLYRAGAFAAVLAQKTGLPAALYQEGLGEEEKEAFIRGLRSRGWTEDPVFSGSAPGLSSGEELPPLGCVVLAGRGEQYLARGETPLILFSWVNPDLFPRTVAAVFEDSPWVQLGPALDLLEKGESRGFIPSKITLMEGRERFNQEYLALNGIKTLKYNQGNTDN